MIYCEFFSVGFVAAVMLDLDVEVQGDIRAIELIAFVIGTLEFLLNFDCQPSIFLSVF